MSPTPNPSEFLVRVRPLPDGGFEATCQVMEAPGLREVPCGYNLLRISVSAHKDAGHGATPLAAMIAALANSQVQDITQTQEGQDA